MAHAVAVVARCAAAGPRLLEPLWRSMAKKVLILRAAGINCDEETAFAWELAGAVTERVHVRRLIVDPGILDRFDALTIPGGFSYGDDVAAGRILANQLTHHLADAVRQFIEKGRPVLGICNGFQVLVRAGLLPGIDGRRDSTVTLTNNDSGRFEDRWVHLYVDTDRCVFLPKGARLELPVAHGEGKLIPADDSIRAALRDRGHIALRYCDEQGRPGGFPVNPNGSVDDIAGLTDATGLILGLMPHPERHVFTTQHPARFCRSPDEIPSGRIVFESALRFMSRA